MKIRPVGAELFRADGQTDMTKLIVAFHSSANASGKKKPPIYIHSKLIFSPTPICIGSLSTDARPPFNVPKTNFRTSFPFQASDYFLAAYSRVRSYVLPFSSYRESVQCMRWTDSMHVAKKITHSDSCSCLSHSRLLNRVTSVTEPTVDTTVRCTRKHANLWRNTGYFIVTVPPVMALGTAYWTAPWMPLKVAEMSSLIYQWLSSDINVGTRAVVRRRRHSSRQCRKVVTVHMLLDLSKLQ